MKFTFRSLFFGAFFGLTLLLFTAAVTQAQKPTKDSTISSMVSTEVKSSDPSFKANLDQVSSKMNEHKLLNAQQKGDDLIFFAFEKEDSKEKTFNWYKQDANDLTLEPEVIYTSDRFSSLFDVAVSPDGKEMFVISKNGEILVKDLKTGTEKSLGVFQTTVDSGRDLATYKFPIYSPDGNWIFLHNPWENQLFVLDANSKNINQGQVFDGFWLVASGGGELESGMYVSPYEFLSDENLLIFGGIQTLNLNSL